MGHCSALGRRQRSWRRAVRKAPRRRKEPPRAKRTTEKNRGVGGGRPLCRAPKCCFCPSGERVTGQSRPGGLPAEPICSKSLSCALWSACVQRLVVVSARRQRSWPLCNQKRTTEDHRAAVPKALRPKKEPRRRKKNRVAGKRTTKKNQVRKKEPGARGEKNRPVLFC